MNKAENQTTSTSEIMTADELAAYLKMPVASIYKRSCKGQIPCAKLGSVLRFPKAWIDQWILDNAKGKERVAPSQTRFQEARLRLRSLKTETTETPISEQRERG